MLYVYQGEVWITEAGRAVPEYIAMAESKKYQGKRMAEAMMFVYHVYTKIDYVANKKNIYWQMPISERKETVVSQYGLFGKGGYEKLEACELYDKFLDFYVRATQTDNDRNYEAFRAKAEYWREQMSNIDNSPDEDLKIAKALENASQLAEEYKVKSELEALDESKRQSGLYLFEVPEEQKPHDLKLSV